MTDVRPSGFHPAHQRNWDLLPCYHNGSLEAEACAEVEAHLGECLMCVRELRRLEQLSTAVAAPAHEHACAQAFQRLSEQIRAQSAWHRRLLAALRALAAPAPAMALVALLAAAVLAGLPLVEHESGAEALNRSFRTLGAKPSRPSELSHPLVRVVLRDHLAAGTTEAWLVRHAAEVIDGPTAIGVLTVRVALGARPYDEVLEQMRADSETLFVEPIDVIGTRPDRLR